MTKYKNHPWPTDGATRKYVDRNFDRLTRRVDRQGESIRDLKARLFVLEEILSSAKHIVVSDQE